MSVTQHILRREGETGSGCRWRQYLLIRDASVTVLELVPALYGWNIGKVWEQGADDWDKQTADQILAWKMANDDGLSRVVTDEAEHKEVIACLAKGSNHLNRCACWKGSTCDRSDCDPDACLCVQCSDAREACEKGTCGAPQHGGR